jgi:hypothetical protein
MPELSRFFGIVIAMYYNDHDPPHFHVRYGSCHARFALESLHMIDGDIGPRARGLVVEWASRHQPELQREWELARAGQPLFPIAPLE